MEHLWYKNAVFYSLDVETFYDSNGDGIGDFPGLITKLDYLSGLGINCIWLLPFFPSPNRDNGYDVMDYYNVDQRLGDLGDFSAFLDKAANYGIKVIIDLVVNHTSVEHPWFRQARNDPNSPYRNYYIWSDEPLEFEKEHLMFTGEENTIWTFDDKAGQYYLHRFYKEQPDLNIANPAVKKEILKIMGFWLNLGVSGFRIDAAELLVDPYGMKGAEKKDLQIFFDEMRGYVATKKTGAILLAEVNAKPQEMTAYLHKGERMHMLFNFYLNQHLFLSLAKKNIQPVMKALKEIPVLGGNNQWLNFLRHHDELNIKLLNKAQQKIVFDQFAPQQNMRIYGFGIRRRLAPMMKGNKSLLQLSYSLLFSMPGVPLVRYGDEIGMGEDLSLEGRTSVRTPMQWSPRKNAGFSAASKNKLVHPVIKQGDFSYDKINVLSAQHQAASLLNWIERLITTRKQCPEIGFGTLKIIPSTNNKILIHSYQWKNEELFFIHNFSDQQQVINKKKTGLAKTKFFDVFGDGKKKKDSAAEIMIEGYGYRWFRKEQL